MARHIPDDLIAQHAKQQLAWDIHVDASRVDVQVHDGAVRLTGSVETVEARQAAEAAIWGIEGVD